jgi:hypothetical protein
VGGTEKNSPWCENEGSVQHFFMIVIDSSNALRLRSWSWIVEPYGRPSVSFSRG